MIDGDTLLELHKIRRQEETAFFLLDSQDTQIGKNVKVIYSYLLEMAEIVTKNREVFNNYGNFVQTLSTYLKRYNFFIETIKKYSAPGGAQKSEIADLGRQIRSFIHEQLEFDTGNGLDFNPPNLIVLYNTIKNHIPASNNTLDKQLKELTLLQSQSSTLKDDLSNYVQTARSYVEELGRKSSEIVIADYVTFFTNQAEKHSSYSITFTSKRPFIHLKLGQSEKYLLSGILLMIGTIFFAFNYLLEPRNITVQEPSLSNHYIYIYYITRLLIVSFGVYLISFCFKQFSINKHLYTVNKHRENTLNSYKLFISSLDNDDQALRNTVMVEVAKSIYDMGSTGYLPGQGQQDNSPSIIELTKFVSERGK